MTTSDAVGAKARQAMIDIFRTKDMTAVDRTFGKSFIQHDRNLADGVAGMKSFAAEIASSPAADITIYRTLVDGDFVLLHSRYEGAGRYAGPVIAFDLFRFKDGTIVEHWGGQQPETPPNPSGRTEVDGATWDVRGDREKTRKPNRTLVRTYRETRSWWSCGIFDRIEEFFDTFSHAACLESRRWHRSVAGSDRKRGQARRAAAPRPASFRGRGQLRACSVGRRHPVGTYCTLRSVSNRGRKDRRALGRANAHTPAGSVEKCQRTFLSTEVLSRTGISLGGPQPRLLLETLP